MSNTFDKLSVLDSFIEEVNSYLPEIETNLERLTHSPGDMDALEETYRRTHTIGGSASMMDFPGLAHVAHGMEDILGDALDGITTLEEPTLGLLRRSLGRLHQLLEGIRNGIDEEAVIAEDDADYSRYRAFVEASTQSVQSSQSQSASPAYSQSSAQEVEDHAVINESPQQQEFYTFSEQPQQFDIPFHSTPAPMPSFDEVLASFRTPAIDAGEELAWPEESAALADSIDPSMQFFGQETPPPAVYSSFQPSALDALVASTRKEPVVSLDQPITSEPAPIFDQPVPEDTQPIGYGDTSGTELVAHSDAPMQVYENVQKDAQHLETEASALKNLVAQLHEAVSAIEAQRGEFKGFLDGSKDALDRMEDWAGQAMGLNLRNSPEQVRRYLPLSVMWVTNSKLKKVLDLLNQITNGAVFTDEQMNGAFQQLQLSLSSFGEAFRQVQDKASGALAEEPGWTQWEMQAARDQDTLRERVTFERQGDLATLRAQMEAQLRQQIQQEYEARPVPLTLRAEMEQQIRLEMRQEFEERRRLQERVAGPNTVESQQEMEARLRSEIEIQVRQEFLKQITANERELLSAQSSVNHDSPSSVSNFIDRASAVTGRLSSSLPPMFPPSSSRIPASAVSGTSSSLAADLGDEAEEIFRAEAEEHLQTISMHVAALEKSPQNLELIQVIRRATHTLKGAAGMMGFRAIADLSHVSEDLLDSIMEGTTTISSVVLSLILDTAETLDILISGRESEMGAAEARVHTLRMRYIDLLGEEHSTPLPQGHADEYIDTETDRADDSIGSNSGVARVIADGQSIETNAQRTMRGELSVRVRLQKLDELVNLFGELLVNRSVLEERIQRLVRLVADVGVSSNRLYGVGQKLESRFEAATLPSGHAVQAMPGEGDQSLVQRSISNSNHGANSQNKYTDEPSHLAEFDELELDRYTEFHQLARGLSEGISDMTTLSTEMDAIIRESESIFARENRLNATFQDRLMKIRLVPLSSMAPRLYRAARAVALKQGKDFEFLLEGEDTEVDRTVFEEIAGPLLHLIRNSVNHAIETPDIRMQKGKSPVGQIKLSAAYEGNQVVITVSDDGSGIDPEHVRNTAIHRGLIRTDQMLNEADVLDLIFLSGFSTAEVLSEESGRGVGLDVVRDSVSRLRGTLAVDSTPGHGTSFIMKFPTSLAIQSAMMVKVGGQQFAIPTVMVEAIGRLDNFKRTSVAGQPALSVRSEVYLLNTLSQYLSLPSKPLDEKSQVLLVNAGGHRVALLVEEIKSKQDIVTKNLGPHLRHVHGILGGTVLGNGRVVLILELTELLSQRQKMGDIAGVPTIPMPEEVTPLLPPAPSRQTADVSPSIKLPSVPGRAAPAAVTRPERGKHVLVVDDSPSVRRVVGNMLKQRGWEVQMARDGVEALEMISNEAPAAVLLDIEMPRMDGYELIATVRAQDQYRTLPLVVLTSRAASKHQQRAMQLGASAYVVKPYQDEELLNTLNALVYGAVAR